MNGSDAEENIQELIKSLLQGYQIGLIESIKGSNFLFGSVEGFFYKCCKINV